MNLKHFLNRNNFREKDFNYFQNFVIGYDRSYLAQEDLLKDFETWLQLTKSLEQRDPQSFFNIYNREFLRKNQFKLNKSKIKTKIDESLLIFATLYKENVSVIRFLIEKQSVDPNCHDSLPLIMASSFNFPKIVQYLLEKGSNPTFQDGKSFLEASQQGYSKILELLYLNRYDMSPFLDQALEISIKHRHVEAEFLIRQFIEKSVSKQAV